MFLQILGPLEPGAIGRLLSRPTHYLSLSTETTLVSLLAPNVVATGVLASGSHRVVCTVRITVVFMPIASALRGWKVLVYSDLSRFITTLRWVGDRVLTTRTLSRRFRQVTACCWLAWFGVVWCFSMLQWGMHDLLGLVARRWHRWHPGLANSTARLRAAGMLVGLVGRVSCVVSVRLGTFRAVVRLVAVVRKFCWESFVTGYSCCIASYGSSLGSGF